MRVRTFRFFIYALLGVGLLSFAVLFMLYRAAESNWETQASAYDTKHEYATLQLTNAARRFLLNSGLSDSNFLYRVMDDLNCDAYRSAIQKIPESDGERLIWEYYCYIYPYEGGLYPQKDITNYDDRLERAIDLAINLPYAPMRNEFMDKILRYEKTHFALSFALFYRNTEDNSHENVWKTQKRPTASEKIRMTTSAIHMLDVVDGKLDLTTLAQQGVYGMFNIHAFELAKANIETKRLRNELPCDHVMVNNYVNIRAKLYARLRYTSMDEVSLLSKINRETARADAILAKWCGITF